MFHLNYFYKGGEEIKDGAERKILETLLPFLKIFVNDNTIEI